MWIRSAPTALVDRAHGWACCGTCRTGQSSGYPRCQILESPSMSPSVRVDTAPIATR